MAEAPVVEAEENVLDVEVGGYAGLGQEAAETAVAAAHGLEDAQ